MKNKILFLLVFAFSIGLSSCDEKEKRVFEGKPYDPAIACEYKEFLPMSGGVGEKLIIKGDNFGTDTALVEVAVNGKPATVIGVNQLRIYAVVPTRADTGKVFVAVGELPEGYQTVYAENEDKDPLEVFNNEENDIINPSKVSYDEDGNPVYETDYRIRDPRDLKVFEEDFLYIFRQNVTTLTGQTDVDGKSKNEDGTLQTAWFGNTSWITTDSEGVMYLAEEHQDVRIINQVENLVTTPYKQASRWRTLQFTLTEDTLLIAHDGPDNNSATAVYIATRNLGFMNFKPYLYGGQCNTCFMNPIDGEIYYNSYTNGEVFRWNPITNTKEQQMKLDQRTENHGVFSKDGRYAYIVNRNRSVIYRAEYDFENKKLSLPVIFAGAVNGHGYADGIGATARFNKPCQPTVDDAGFLYVADRENHCIRMISPAGIVSTFAGVPKEEGYLDGEPYMAKFKQPEGLHYSDYDGAFYVGDWGNHRIRRIVVE